MRSELLLRFGLGKTEPWLRREGGRLVAIAGPNTVYVDGPVAQAGVRDSTVEREFEVEANQAVEFQLSWCALDADPPPAVDAAAAIERTGAWWQEWAEPGSGRAGRGWWATSAGRGRSRWSR